MEALLSPTLISSSVQPYTSVSDLNPDAHYTILIDYARDGTMPEVSKTLLKEGKYMLPAETSPQQAFARGAIAYASNQDHAQRLYDYVSKQWFMFASPVLASAGNPRGSPVSCFLSTVTDSREDIASSWEELLWMSTEGGGAGQDWSQVRSVGERTSRGTSTPGLMPFLHVVDSIIISSVQGEVRRGAVALYLDVSHPEVESFLDARKPTGGDPHRKIINSHYGINISDKFMNAVEKGLDWELIDPNSGKVKSVVKARDLWDRILVLRMETGEPYLHFIDTANKALPQCLKDKGLRINNSNLCSEIHLPTSQDRTAVCVLSSTNLEHYDAWSQVPEFIPDLIEMLDNVLDAFCRKAPKQLSKAVFSASQERSLGLGAMGFHSYLQSKGIPFEGAMASSINRRMFRIIKDGFINATHRLASEKGEAPDIQTNLVFWVGPDKSFTINSSTILNTSRGKIRAFEVATGDVVEEFEGQAVLSVIGRHDYTGRRNSHGLALAPNASSAVLCGSPSPSIEPTNANVFVQKTSNGSFPIRNKYLDHVLRSTYNIQGEALETAWREILVSGGSVQHFDWMSQEDKEVFKTARELDQNWILEHASVRQAFLCQGQSINLFIPNNAKMSYLRALHKSAWKKGLKALYYVRSEASGRMKSPEVMAMEAERANKSACLSCEG
jgi:ribonucleoside-diphosphate reductase alpha chain